MLGLHLWMGAGCSQLWERASASSRALQLSAGSYLAGLQALVLPGCINFQSQVSALCFEVLSFRIPELFPKMPAPPQPSVAGRSARSAGRFVQPGPAWCALPCAVGLHCCCFSLAIPAGPHSAETEGTRWFAAAVDCLSLYFMMSLRVA